MINENREEGNNGMSNIKDNLKKEDLKVEGKTKEALDKFISDGSEYSNVGIIGDLGVGKSSVICSYLKGKENIQAVYLSIPRFKNSQEKDEIQEAKEIRKIIVYLLVEAIRTEYSKVPCVLRRIGYSVRLEKIEDKINSNYSLVQGKKYIKAFSIISTFLIIIPLSSIVNRNEYLKNHFLYSLVFIAIIGIIIYNIIMFVLELNIKNFNIGKVKVEQKEESSFLDEDTNFILSLLYLYSTMTTKKIILIIEDLDRYENEVIFEELYQISNIKKDITFVYLIKNSQFKSEHILKYFDAIVDLQSTKDILYLEDVMMNDLAGEIYSNLVVTIVPYIRDIRQYNRIYNRYYLMKENYEKAHEISDEIQNEIFTLAFLKELFYDQIQNESNKLTDFKKCVDTLFDEKKQKEVYEKSLKVEIDERSKEINEVEENIKKYDDMYLVSENLEEEALDKLLKGYLYENYNKKIEGTNYNGIYFLNNPDLLQRNYNFLLKYFKIKKFSSSKKIIKKKEELEEELEDLKESLENIKTSEFEKLNNADKVKPLVGNEEFEFEELDLIVDLICKDYLNQHWDIYLTPNNLENEMEVAKRRMRYNFRKSNNEIENGNVIYNDNFDKNKSFIDLFHYSDFEKNKELINESLLLFLWNNNNEVDFDDKLKSVNICIRNNINDEKVTEICKKVLVSIINSVGRTDYENKFMEYLTQEFIEVLIAVAKDDETLKKSIVEVFISCRVKVPILDIGTKYALTNIGIAEIDDEIIKNLLSKIIAIDDNIIDNLEEFVNKIKEKYKFNLLEEYKEEMVKTEFYISNTKNILYLIKENVVTYRVVEELNDNINSYAKYIPRINDYLDNNYKEIKNSNNKYKMPKGGSIDDNKLFELYLRNVKYIKKYEDNKELLNFIIKDRRFEVNKYNAEYLLHNFDIEEVSGDMLVYLYENDDELFEEYIRKTSDRIVGFIEQYEEENYKTDIVNKIVKKELLEDDILKQLIDEVPMYLSKDYSDNINDYILEQTECKYDEIKGYIDKSGRKDKKYYLQLINTNFEQFLKDFNLENIFSFTNKGRGKNEKYLEKITFIVEDTDVMHEMLEQAKEEGVISFYEIKNKVKIKK